MDSPPPLPPLPETNLGGSLAVTFLSLGLVCLLAYVSLKWLGRRGVGQGNGPLRIVARLPLEPRRTLFLVEVAGRCFLIGAGEGAMSTLAEIDRDKLESEELLRERARSSRGGIRFAEVLARLRSRLPANLAARATAAESTRPLPVSQKAEGAPADDLGKAVPSAAGERP
jgi:flagellar biosynthetic protein FliO